MLQQPINFLYCTHKYSDTLTRIPVKNNRSNTCYIYTRLKFSGFGFVQRLKTIATLVNYKCKSFIELTPGFLNNIIEAKKLCALVSHRVTSSA